jgi:hypothetical protein
MKYTILAPDAGVSEANLMTEEQEVLAFNVSDEALEIAAGTVSGKINFTWGVCTLDQAGCPG